VENGENIEENEYDESVNAGNGGRDGRRRTKTKVVAAYGAGDGGTLLCRMISAVSPLLLLFTRSRAAYAGLFVGKWFSRRMAWKDGRRSYAGGVEASRYLALYDSMNMVANAWWLYNAWRRRAQYGDGERDGRKREGLTSVCSLPLCLCLFLCTPFSSV
jgi:hypothetical protein